MTQPQEFIELANVEELTDGAMMEVESDGHALIVARVGDQVYVADAHCPHLHARLAKGTLEGTVLTCPLHGSQFDLADGHNIRWTDWQGAAKTMAEFVRHSRPLRVYKTRVEDGVLFVGPQKEPPSQA